MPFHSYQSAKERALFDLLGELDLSVDKLESTQNAGTSSSPPVVAILSTPDEAQAFVGEPQPRFIRLLPGIFFNSVLRYPIPPPNFDCFHGAAGAGSASNDASEADIPGGTSHAPPSSLVTVATSGSIVSAPQPYSPPSRRRAPSSTANANARYKRNHICIQCGIAYDRFARARDCRNWHLGLTPHVCGGVCGNSGCNAAYWSEAFLREHTAAPIQCPPCGKILSKRNFARHRNEYCPAYSSPA